MKKITAILTLFIFAISCSTPKTDQQAEAEKIMELSREWAKSAQTGDTDKILSYWSNDAVVISPGQPPMRGQDELRKMVEMNSSIPGFKVNWNPKESFVSESGDLGYTIGKNYFKMLDSLGNEITRYNNVMEVWKKQDNGSWKCVVDISSPDPSITSIK